jgi:hypothetical protein
VEVHVLAIQARILLAVGVGWLAFGLWLGQDPVTVAWRAALGAWVACWVGGKLIRIAVRVLEERIASDLAERALKAEEEARRANPALVAAKQRMAGART